MRGFSRRFQTIPCSCSQATRAKSIRFSECPSVRKTLFHLVAGILLKSNRNKKKTSKECTPSLLRALAAKESTWVGNLYSGVPPADGFQ